ncbi:MAG: prepilin-type N-terminal cleavage/methylation domain-containing protein [Gammaproteobacteria bacterium]|jgi:type IV pilus assembly protein PilE|nr:prepilin-type N-terminal cleavage/methylation domain-containing protein [Gammaproteobacteria bacterium]MBT6585931.1 prepilin-type N-terminal cleavage/methylation domain-containing protein [Gammaproteobacteria bacterium]
MKMKGFSLIELMIALAIIGVISSIAYPSYQSYIQDTYYAQARVDTKVCAQALGRFYANGFTYVGGAAQCTLWSPASGTEAASQYTLTVPTATATDYTVVATPVSGACDGRCYSEQADGTESVF